MRLKGLPENDNQLWLIKWIDEFRLPHLRTRSASVSILFQRIELQDPKSLSRLQPEDIERILAASNDQQDAWIKATELAGYLPYLSIGMVFQNGLPVGQLPSNRNNIELTAIDSPSNGVSIEDKVTPPRRWEKKYPYRTINRSEFSGLMSNGFSRSKCFIHLDGDTQYIIPRSVIFRCFYGQSTSIVNAFCKGPWPATSSDVICYSELDSGLVTRCNDQDGTWDIILQPKTNIQHGRLLAALIFDDYAKACAASIYTNALRDRGTNSQNPWFASARIPFDISRQPLNLGVKGYYLKTFSTAPRKYLVTTILSAPFPKHFPVIRYEKAHSGAKGKDITKVDEPAPFQTASTTKPAPSDITGSSEEDINVDEGALAILADDFSWTDPQPMEKLVKPTSKQYQSPNQVAALKPDGDEVSAGTRTHQQGGLTEAQLETLVRRDRSNQFGHLLQVFDDFIANGVVDSYSVFAPTDRSMYAARGGLPCWNFLNEDSRTTGKWPRRSWRLLEQAAKDRDGAIGVPRSALVLEVTRAGFTGYWIEIEVRPGSTEGFRSPYIVTDEDPHEAIAHFIEIIAELKGVQLYEKLPQEAAALKNTTVRCYKHQYASKEDSSLNRRSIVEFLSR